jgi:hypothetical protein
MKLLQQNQLSTSPSEHYVKKHYMSVNSNPTVFQQNKNKTSYINIFSFIAGVDDASD